MNTNNRKLGSTEQAMEIMNRYDKYFIVTVSRIKGKLSAEVVRQALDLLQSRHPPLNSRIVGSGDDLYFQTAGTPKIPLRVIEKISNEQWPEVLQAELNEKLDSSQGLVRSVLIHLASVQDTYYLIITVHHAIALASSVLRLHSELLTYCHQITTNEPIKIEDTLPAIAPIEKLLPQSATGLRGIINNFTFLFSTFLKTTLHRPQSLGFNKSLSPDSHHRNLVISRQISSEFTKQLVKTCREKTTTVQGALCAAMMLSAIQVINSPEHKAIPIICHSSIDLRKFLETPINEDYLILAFSYSTGFFTINTKTDFWDLAKNVKQKLNQDLTNNKKLFNKVLTYKQITDICLKNPNAVPDTVAVTNIGQLHIQKNYNSLTIEEISFIPVQSVVNNNFTIAVCTFDEKLFLNFMFCEPTINRKKMDKFVDYTLSCLMNACK